MERNHTNVRLAKTPNSTSTMATITDMYMKAKQEVCKALIEHRLILPTPPLVLGIYNSNIGTPILPGFFLCLQICNLKLILSY